MSKLKKKQKKSVIVGIANIQTNFNNTITNISNHNDGVWWHSFTHSDGSNGHKLPENYAIGQKMSTGAFFTLWFCGNKNNKIRL